MNANYKAHELKKKRQSGRSPIGTCRGWYFGSGYIAAFDDFQPVLVLWLLWMSLCRNVPH